MNRYNLRRNGITIHSLFFSFFVLYCTLSLSLFAGSPSQRIPIVTVEENNRIEELDDGTGVNEERFMFNAGEGVAKEAETMLNFDTTQTVTIPFGKGYKGGNALWAGCQLLQKGYKVRAYSIASLEESPAICQRIAKTFQKRGGTLQFFQKNLESSVLIIDGLVGTGFKGGAKGSLAQMIEAANDSGVAILAVDIPSGLNGNTGEVETTAIRATRTVAISFPKIGFFTQTGQQYIGTLTTVNIGISQSALDQTQPEAYLLPNGIVKKCS